MIQSFAHDLKNLLHQQGRLRVWSIIVTIMGDLVETIGGEITIAEIIEICTRLDIEPQAVRTAMSRLTKEGWVERIPDGRSTKYRFSDERRGEFNNATRYIYARPEDAPKNWMVGILPPWPQAKKRELIMTMSAVHPIIINKQMAIWPQFSHRSLPQDCREVMTIFDKLPEDMAKGALEDVTPPPQCALIELLCHFSDAVQRDDHLSHEDALVIRIVLVHFWRRMVLRHIHIHSPFDEAFWPLPKLHRIMASLYPKLAEKSAHAIGYDIDEAMVSGRFKHPANL